MALTFPLVLPEGVASEYFEPERVDFQSPRTDGRVGGVTAGFPLWHARWSLGRALSRDQSEQWRAFTAALRGQQRTFLGGDQGRPFPKAYPNGFTGQTRAGGGGFDGTVTAWSVNADRDVATLQGLPAGFLLSFGDYVMWRWTTSGAARRALCRLVEPATANGSGVLAATVEPALPTLVPAGAIADFARPTCIMRLKPESRIGEKSRAGRVDASLTAIQDLRA